MENAPQPTGNAPARKGAERRRAWVTLPEPTTRATRTRRGINILGVIIAVAAAVMLVPAIYRHQLQRIAPVRERTSRMYDLVSITQNKAIERFGQPNAQKEYQLTKGSVMGPLLGQKKLCSAGLVRLRQTRRRRESPLELPGVFRRPRIDVATARFLSDDLVPGTAWGD